MCHREDARGFTIIELMIVVAIVGILATIAIPNFYGMQKTAKTSEAKSNLGAIWMLEEAYQVENDSYVVPITQLPPGVYNGTNGWSELGFYPKGTTRYNYEIVSADDATFLARASGDIDGDSGTDTWTIDEVGNLQHDESD